jgi:hypothetical protein
VHTLKGLIRSLSQAQITEKKRGRSHGPSAGHQIGNTVLDSMLENSQKYSSSRFFEEVKIDPATGEPAKVTRSKK